MRNQTCLLGFCLNNWEVPLPRLGNPRWFLKLDEISKGRRGGRREEGLVPACSPPARRLLEAEEPQKETETDSQRGWKKAREKVVS